MFDCLLLPAPDNALQAVSSRPKQGIFILWVSAEEGASAVPWGGVFRPAVSPEKIHCRCVSYIYFINALINCIKDDLIYLFKVKTWWLNKELHLWIVVLFYYLLYNNMVSDFLNTWDVLRFYFSLFVCVTIKASTNLQSTSSSISKHSKAWPD